MKVTINGDSRELADGGSLGDAVRLVTTATTGVAVAVNDAVVPRAGWDSTRLADGDTVEVLTAVQGG